MGKFPTTKKLSAIAVSPDDIHLFEEFICNGLSKICSITGEAVSYNDIVENCTVHTSTLFIIFVAGSNIPLGFYVLTYAQHTGNISLNISSAFYSICLYKTGLLFALQKVEEYAIIVGATEVWFSTPRKGAKKVAENNGFALLNFINGNYYYSKEISYGG